jgi:hypothetical protein
LKRSSRAKKNGLAPSIFANPRKKFRTPFRGETLSVAQPEIDPPALNGQGKASIFAFSIFRKAEKKFENDFLGRLDRVV